jgi:hypothetical protein
MPILQVLRVNSGMERGAVGVVWDGEGCHKDMAKTET